MIQYRCLLGLTQTHVTRPIPWITRFSEPLHCRRTPCISLAYGIIKKKVSGFVKVNIVSHRPPELTSTDALSIQQTVELIMTIGVALSSKVRLGEVLKTS